MTANELNNNSESNTEEEESSEKDTDKDEEQDEAEGESETSEEDEDEDEEDDPTAKSTDSKLVKKIKKERNKVRKAQKVFKNKLMQKLQILIGIFLLIAVLSWNTIESVLHWLSGLEEVTITAKTTSNGCYQITTSEDEHYCVDEISYEMAEVNSNYLLEENQYSYGLRTVDRHGFEINRQP